MRQPPSRAHAGGLSRNAGGTAGLNAFRFPNDAEGGTSGVTVTTGNSGGTSGSAFDSVFVGTAATLAFDNSEAAHGLLSYKVATGTTSTTSLLEWTTTAGNQRTVWFRAYCFMTAA